MLALDSDVCPVPVTCHNMYMYMCMYMCMYMHMCMYMSRSSA